MVRSMLGGGTPQVEARSAPAPIEMSEVLVASANLIPGQALAASQVRWEKWPTASVDAGFITHAMVPSIDEAVKDRVVRVPIMAGQPIAQNAVVQGTGSGLMAAMLTPGMRAVSIVISAESGAGGFILPNDRIDVILTRKPDGNNARSISKTILTNVRVLAVDQTISQNKDTPAVVGKTATLEVTQAQAELLGGAQGNGQLSLALRPLSEDIAVADAAVKTQAAYEGPVSIIRYGMASNGRSAGQQENEQ
jgi:pilus assembly protein CpaB